MSHNNSGLEQFGGIFGTVVSAAFLYLIAALNIVILAGIVKVFRACARASSTRPSSSASSTTAGLMFRFFGRWMKSITKEWQMYPVGVVFGLGFDTATEVALLATTALLADPGLPWYSIMCLPILFTAGMALMDTLDGWFMNVAYGWAFFNPVRKVYYNLAITGLSVFICFFIGTHRDLSGSRPRSCTARALLELHGQLQHQHRRVTSSWGCSSWSWAGAAPLLEVRAGRGALGARASCVEETAIIDGAEHDLYLGEVSYAPAEPRPSSRRRAITLRQSVSSAPSKIDSTRASTKSGSTGYSSA